MSTITTTVTLPQYIKVTATATDKPKNQLIPSPPLSPSLEAIPEEELEIIKPQYCQENYPLASLANYDLKVNAWSNLHKSNYLSKCSSFLNQYYILANQRKIGRYNRESVKKTSTNYRKRVREDVPSSEASFEKIRTRRNTKSINNSSESEDNTTVITSPKKRKVVRNNDVNNAKPIDWESLPDYSPSLSTLPSNNSRILHTEWKGQPMNLLSDPLINKLHPAEVQLASVLRLPCNIYLDSKRRLFNEKVSRLRKNLPFRRTDAQKACRIDVNKASRLFASFEKAGWLEDYHFDKYL